MSMPMNWAFTWKQPGSWHGMMSKTTFFSLGDGRPLP